MHVYPHPWRVDCNIFDLAMYNNVHFLNLNGCMHCSWSTAGVISRIFLCRQTEPAAVGGSYLKTKQLE